MMHRTPQLSPTPRAGLHNHAHALAVVVFDDARAITAQAATGDHGERVA